MPLPSSHQRNFSVSYNGATCQLSIIWEGKVAMNELKEGYEAALEIIRNEKVKRILIDMTKRVLDFPESPSTLFNQIFSEALKYFRSTLFLALVVPQEEYFFSTEASRFTSFQGNPNDYVITNQFLTRSDAEAWLEKSV